MLDKWTALGLWSGFLNLMDAVFTLTLVGLGIGQEANPIMDYLLTLDPYVFLGIKVVITPLFLLMGLNAREGLFSKISLSIISAIYTTIVCYQLWALITVLLSTHCS